MRYCFEAKDQDFKNVKVIGLEKTLECKFARDIIAIRFPHGRMDKGSRIIIIILISHYRVTSLCPSVNLSCLKIDGGLSLNSVYGDEVCRQ